MDAIVSITEKIRDKNSALYQGLYPNDLMQFSKSKLDNTIYELKRFLLLTPDDNLLEILNC